MQAAPKTNHAFAQSAFRRQRIAARKCHSARLARELSLLLNAHFLTLDPPSTRHKTMAPLTNDSAPYQASQFDDNDSSTVLARLVSPVESAAHSVSTMTASD